MRPDANVWRKHQRATLKGVPSGRRATHRAQTQDPTPGSTWARRQRAKLLPWSTLPTDGGV